jgi:hypothetical protein
VSPPLPPRIKLLATKFTNCPVRRCFRGLVCATQMGCYGKYIH